jgi:hypothetical protein
MIELEEESGCSTAKKHQDEGEEEDDLTWAGWPGDDPIPYIENETDVESPGLYWFTNARTFFLLETYKFFKNKFVGARQPLVLWGKIDHFWKKKGLRGLLLECAKINLRTSKLGTRPSFPVEKTPRQKEQAIGWFFMQ